MNYSKCTVLWLGLYDALDGHVMDPSLVHSISTIVVVATEICHDAAMFM